MITAFNSDMLINGGSHTVYIIRDSLIDKIDKRGDLVNISAKLGISPSTFLHCRRKKPTLLVTAQKIAECYGVPLDKAFEKKTDKSPLSSCMVLRLNTTLSGLFAVLVKAGVLTVNPCLNAEKPTLEQKPAAYLDNVTFPIFINALEQIQENNVKIALSLCLYLGVRSGEARALKWTDVDFEKDILHIRNGVNTSTKGLIIDKPKTKRSVRDLPLLGGLPSLLRDHKEKQTALIATLGTAWNDNNLVAPNTTGGIMTDERLLKEMKEIVKANPELPPNLSPHKLRHSFVSLLIDNGVDIIRVAALVGDSVKTVSQVYAHSFKEREAAAMQTVTDVFDQLSKPRIEKITFTPQFRDIDP